MREVIINVNRQFSGYTFALSALQRKALEEEFGVSPSPSLFISYDTKTGLEPHRGKIRKFIIPFMLGLSEKQISNLIVKLRNLATNEELLIQ